MLYFKIHATSHEIVDFVEGDFSEYGYNDKESSLGNGKDFLVETAITKPTFDQELEKLEGPVDTYDYPTNIAIRTYTMVAKTQEELDQEQVVEDTAALTTRGKDVVLVLVQLVDKLLADSVIEATDFDVNTRAAFQDIKVIADRIATNQ